MKPSTRDLTGQLRDMVLRGEFAAGERMREENLAERFSVSRTPIRAALAAIANDGLLEYNPNRGYSVRAFNLADITAAYEMRAILEGVACRKAAERGLSLEAERDARRAIDLVQSLFQDGKTFDDSAILLWREQNVMFHMAIQTQATNRFLREMLEMVQRIPAVYPPMLTPYRLEELEQFNAQHRKILECILDRQGERAEYLMREHVLGASELATKQMQEGSDQPQFDITAHALWRGAEK